MNCFTAFIFFFFFNDTATTEIYTLSLHDALPISLPRQPTFPSSIGPSDGFRTIAENHGGVRGCVEAQSRGDDCRSEEHTSELQSLRHLVCRLLLEKKKKRTQVRHLYQYTAATAKS